MLARHSFSLLSLNRLSPFRPEHLEMTLEFSAPLHFLLVAPDPRNHSIIDVKRKDTGILVYRKIRHMVPNLYALSLIQPGMEKFPSFLFFFIFVLGASARFS